MLGNIVIFGTLLTASLAEPYAPSGWRPKGSSFSLPNAYFAPQRNSRLELEITKERVEHAGQLSAALNKGYAPPSSSYNPNQIDVPSGDDILRVQGLPIRPSTLFKIVSSSQLNNREFLPQRQIQRPFGFSGNIRQQPFDRQRLQQFKIPAVRYSAPIIQPEEQYGAPAVQPQGYPEPRVPDDNATNNESDFANEENEDIADGGGGSVTKGEYFVLTPEKTLQKVTYKTSQTEEEARNNAFTAELKYAPVDKVNGPLYKYNEQGQLVRIYKK